MKQLIKITSIALLVQLLLKEIQAQNFSLLIQENEHIHEDWPQCVHSLYYTEN